MIIAASLSLMCEMIEFINVVCEWASVKVSHMNLANTGLVQLYLLVKLGTYKIFEDSRIVERNNATG